MRAGQEGDRCRRRCGTSFRCRERRLRRTDPRARAATVLRGPRGRIRACRWPRPSARLGARMRSSHCATDSRARDCGDAAVPPLLAHAERAHFGLQPLCADPPIRCCPAMRRARRFCLTDVKPPGRILAVRSPTPLQSAGRFRSGFRRSGRRRLRRAGQKRRLAHGEDAAADAIACVDDGDRCAFLSSSRAAVRPAKPGPGDENGNTAHQVSPFSPRSTTRRTGRSSPGLRTSMFSCMNARDELRAGLDAHGRLDAQSAAATGAAPRCRALACCRPGSAADSGASERWLGCRAIYRRWSTFPRPRGGTRESRIPGWLRARRRHACTGMDSRADVRVFRLLHSICRTGGARRPRRVPFREFLPSPIRAPRRALERQSADVRL